MIAFLNNRRVGPIGIDLGSRAVKLVQLAADGSRIVEAGRWDIPTSDGKAEGSIRKDLATAQLEALRHVQQGRKFRGRNAVLCLGPSQLFVHNLRIDKSALNQLDTVVRQEVGPRLPYPLDQTELRYVEAADVRQGDTVRREVIVLACHRPVLDRMLQTVEDAGLRPVAVEVEAAALVRCYKAQYRREEDFNQRTLFIHVGNSMTAILIAQGDDVLFLKYVDIGGCHLDDAVARHLNMSASEAWALRRHNGDRRVDQQDPEIARSIAEATRSVVDRLTNEVSMCARYYSVAFRGQPLKRMIVSGGEATPALAERLGAMLDIKSEVGDPLRTFETASLPGRGCQWDVALGSAMRKTE
jgi:type IV pilus assembly protein PilM